MNNKLKQLDESIDKTKKKIEILESTYLISITVKKAIDIISLRDSLNLLQQKRRRLVQEIESGKTTDILDELNKLFASFDINNN